MCDFRVNMVRKYEKTWKRGYKITAGKLRTGHTFEHRIKENTIMYSQGKVELDSPGPIPDTTNTSGWYLYTTLAGAKVSAIVIGSSLIQEVLYTGTCVYGKDTSFGVIGVRAEMIKFQKSRRVWRYSHWCENVGRYIWKTKRANQIPKGRRW